MPANKMPEMPPIYSHRCDGDVMRCLDGNGCECEMSGRPPQRCDYTADQMRAMYLAGIADAKNVVRDTYDPYQNAGVNFEELRANLAALEQEAKK